MIELFTPSSLCRYFTDLLVPYQLPMSLLVVQLHCLPQRTRLSDCSAQMSSNISPSRKVNEHPFMLFGP